MRVMATFQCLCVLHDELEVSAALLVELLGLHDGCAQLRQRQRAAVELQLVPAAALHRLELVVDHRSHGEERPMDSGEVTKQRRSRGKDCQQAELPLYPHTAKQVRGKDGNTRDNETAATG